MRITPMSSPCVSLRLDSFTVDSRLAAWEQSFEELAPTERWLLREACVGSIRLEQAEAMEAEARIRVMARAATVWDNDRALEAEELADKLPRRPLIIARRLRSTRHGCLLMASRWKALHAILEAEGTWNEAHRSMAADLLGIPTLFRDDDPRLDSSDPFALLARIETEIADLDTLANGPLAAIDRHDRLAAEAGVCVEADGLMKAVRSFIARCRRQVEWCLNAIKSRRKPTQRSQVPATPAEPADDQADAPVSEPLATDHPPTPRSDAPSNPVRLDSPSVAHAPNRQSRRAEKARRRRHR
jgi:hypothetical protein